METTLPLLLHTQALKEVHVMQLHTGQSRLELPNQNPYEFGQPNYYGYCPATLTNSGRQAQASIVRVSMLHLIHLIGCR